MSRAKDVTAVTRVLPELALCHSEAMYRDTIMHSLITNLIQMGDSFTTNLTFCKAVFNDFLKVRKTASH